MTGLSYWLGVVDEQLHQWEQACTDYNKTLSQITLSDRRMAAIAVHAIPALIAEVRRLRATLEKERQWRID